MRSLAALALLGLLVAPPAAMALPFCHGFNTVCIRETANGSDCSQAGTSGFNDMDVYVGGPHVEGQRTCNAFYRTHATGVYTQVVSARWSDSNGATYESNSIVVAAAHHGTVGSIAHAQWHAYRYGTATQGCNVMVRVDPADVEAWNACPAGEAPPEHPEIMYGRLLP